MKLAIVSYESIGPLRLGMLRSEVRAAMSMPATPFSKLSQSAVLSDQFRGVGIQVHYAADDTCMAIEVGPPAEPQFEGERFLGRPYEAVRRWFEERDPGLEFDDAGFTSRKLGIAIYAPSALKEPHDPVEAVMIFSRAYFELETGPA